MTSTARGILLVALVGTFGVALALQGWHGWWVDNDLIEYVDGAHAFLTDGRVPDRGVVTSLGSYAPPGLTWFALPGAAMLSDPRLIDVPGNVLLYFGTLAGIFLLARSCFGERCAVLAVLLYGLSFRGLLFAGSMGQAFPGPRAHPFFYVWMTYWTCRWVSRNDARYLAAALLTWAIGMYVFLELAPAVFMLPAAWTAFRPPLFSGSLVLVSAVALLIWFPYLRFEAARGYADLRSQLLMQPLPADDYVASLCNPFLRIAHSDDAPLTVERAESLHPNPRDGFVAHGGRRVLAIAAGLTVNFDTLVPGGSLALLALTLAGFAAIVFRDVSTPELSPSLTTAAAMALILIAIAANEWTLGRALGPAVSLTPDVVRALRMSQALTALAGIVLVARGRLVSFTRSLAASAHVPWSNARVLAIAAIVPWIILLLIAEWGRQDRLMGLWPLQAIVLPFAAAGLAEWAIPSARGARRAAELLVVIIVLGNGLVVSRVGGWRADGWEGADGIEVQATDYVASLVRSKGDNRAAIGFRMFEDTPPAPPMNAVDHRWRYGSDFDVMLEHRNGITNLDRCGESLSAQDRYRIVAAHPPSPEYTYYFDVPDPALRLLKHFGNYDVYGPDR